MCRRLVGCNTRCHSLIGYNDRCRRLVDYNATWHLYKMTHSLKAPGFNP
jgi:hypothetical protein